MTPTHDPRLLDTGRDDTRRFELLEHPERWPEDPAAQRELAELLELHLALGAHGAALAPDLTLPAPSWIRTWGLAAAAVLLMAGVPSAYIVQHPRHLRALAQDTVRLELLARRRSHERAWIAFFQQSTTLLQDFEQNPTLCKKGEEDRHQERDMALVLLEASHQLAAQGAPTQEAEATRAKLHAWLSELAFEDSCLSTERAEQLRQWAAAHNLESQALRMEHHLKGGGA